jgi:hypothetical protein
MMTKRRPPSIIYSKDMWYANLTNDSNYYLHSYKNNKIKRSWSFSHLVIQLRYLFFRLVPL